MQRKAVRFVADVLGDAEKADEIEELSPEEYAERKRIRINPTKEKTIMPAGPTKPELQERIEEALSKIDEALNPALTRKEVVRMVQELDEILNDPADADDEDEEEEDDDDDEDIS